MEGSSAKVPHSPLYTALAPTLCEPSSRGITLSAGGGGGVEPVIFTCFDFEAPESPLVLQRVEIVGEAKVVIVVLVGGVDAEGEVVTCAEGL